MGAAVVRKRVAEQHAIVVVHQPRIFLRLAGTGGAVAGAGLIGMATAPASIPAAVVGGGAALAAGMPFFIGQDIEEQMKEGKKLEDTSLAAAVPAAFAQSALWTGLVRWLLL